MSDPRWSHLHASEQARLEEGNFTRHELQVIKRGEKSVAEAWYSLV
jgi:hypothetical protein